MHCDSDDTLSSFVHPLQVLPVLFCVYQAAQHYVMKQHTIQYNVVTDVNQLMWGKIQADDGKLV